MSANSLPNPRLHLAIVYVLYSGGGIGGLTLAIALAPYKDIQIDIYEGAPKFEAIGAGIVFWGECHKVFKNIGIKERLSAIAPLGETPLEMRRANLGEGRTFGTLQYSTHMAFHRAHLLDELVKILAETNRANIHFGKRCVSYTQSDVGENVVIHFKDGSTATCDVLVGADGIRSAIRRELVKEIMGDEGMKSQDGLVDVSGLRFSCTVGYRFLINPVDLPDHSARKVPKQYCGRNKHLVSYPVANGQFINVLGYSSNPDRVGEWMNGPWMLDVDRSEVQKEYGDFEPEVQGLVNAIEKVSRWCLYEVDPLPQWSKGRVTVLGDACHAMCPFLGSGGGQVVEDAYVLASLLSQPTVTRKDIPQILQLYQSVRKPRVDKVAKCTREAKHAYESMEEYASASDEEIKNALYGLVLWLREGNYDIDADIEKAKKEFELSKVCKLKGVETPYFVKTEMLRSD